AFYAMLVVGLSFFVRRAIGARLWRLLHFASFAIFLAALVHGLASGTDSATLWARALYWSAGASVLFLTLYRLIVTAFVAPASALSRRPTASLTAGATAPPAASTA